MRVDHHAYRRATRVAGLGFMVQIAIALVLLVFGILFPDTVFRFASFYVFGGVLVWLSLLVIFYQHTQERLEALEEDELVAARTGTGSVFESSGGGKVAARRLKLMHSWLIPVVSLIMAVYLAFGAAGMLRYMSRLGDAGQAGRDFLRTDEMGWAIAICLFFAAICFIFSRFVAGMAKLPAWQNLRGGAAYGVGNSLVLLAAAVGLTFRFFDQPQVMVWVAYAIPVFMLLLVVEILVHFVLNMYRPRIPGEVPRPAFDSRVLSLLAAPESIVRSLNEAVDYQFGFDITSSWGYQLVLRSLGWLVGFGVVVLVLLNMMVVVEPHQKAVKLSGGEIVGGVHPPGIMWKLPWPFETAVVYDVGRIRKLPITAQRIENPDVQVWAETIKTDTVWRPFLVGGGAVVTTGDVGFVSDDSNETAFAEVTELYSLVDAEMSVRYRIKPDGLLDYLNFASDQRQRRSRYTVRQNALKALAMRTITQHLSELNLDQVISIYRGELIDSLRRRIQATYDEMGTGVEVVALDVPMLRPAGDVAKFWDDYATAKAQRREVVAIAEQFVAISMVDWIGDPDQVPAMLAAINEWRQLIDEFGRDDPAVIEKQVEIEKMFSRSGGMLAQLIDTAEADRWVKLMHARAAVFRHRGELAAYRAAPELYKQREIMRTLSANMANRRKYVLVGVDPSRVNLAVKLEETPSLFSFDDALSIDGESGQ
ncbi:MAG: SPFH domain-containing protein [Phycisphaerales bacterium]